MNNIIKLLVASMLAISLSVHASSLSYTADNVLTMKRIGQVIVSPDGKKTAFTTMDAIKSATGLKWQYSVYLNNNKLLEKNDEISNLSWMPDGNNLIFITRNNTIWIADIKSNTKKKLLTFKGNIFSLKISPNGNFIAFSGSEKSPESSTLTPKDVSTDHVNARLYLLAIKTGNIRSLTPADYSVAQFFVFPQFDWSPDSKSIALAYQPQVGARYAQESKIKIIHLDNDTTQSISYSETHAALSPTYSTDGKWIAFRSTLPHSTFATELNNDILLYGRTCLADTNTLTTHCLAETPNGNAIILGWNNTSNKIYVLDNDKTNGLRIYAVDLNTATPTQLISKMDGYIEPMTVSLNNTHSYFGFGYETVSTAPEAYISAAVPFHLEKVSHLADNTTPLGNTRVIHWKSTDGMDIEGLLVTPSNYDATKPYPLYVAVHGGPSGTWWQRYLGGCDEYGEMIDPSTCWANLLSLGFVIFEPNPRGSSGYGMKFSLANFSDLGGGDYHDIMSGVDDLIAKKIADPNHLAVGGWSFGGYMTAWIVSQNNRFKAAVDGDGNTDFISFSGTSDIPNYYIKYLGQPFWNNNSLYLQRSPISYAKDLSTPLLILEGENDTRVPPGQAYELYTTLTLQHKPVKMLLLPQQGHVPSDPNVIQESIKEVDAWLKRAL